jgi:hypothetical protein
MAYAPLFPFIETSDTGQRIQVRMTYLSSAHLLQPSSTSSGIRTPQTPGLLPRRSPPSDSSLCFLMETSPSPRYCALHMYQRRIPEKRKKKFLRSSKQKTNYSTLKSRQLPRALVEHIPQHIMQVVAEALAGKTFNDDDDDDDDVIDEISLLMTTHSLV